jgi:RimJ/RimL family protein N-acetyltransferase
VRPAVVSADPRIDLVPVDATAEAAALRAFLTSNAFPFHGEPHPTDEDVDRRIADGGLSAPDHQALWVDAEGHGRIGLAVLDDLDDPGLMFDLRLAERHRGQGLGAPVLRALTAHVFRSFPHATRFEGQTRDDNAAMRRVLRAAGFVMEARYRDGWPVAGGAPRDSVGYGILRRDHETGTTTPVAWDDLG